MTVMNFWTDSLPTSFIVHICTTVLYLISLNSKKPRVSNSQTSSKANIEIINE